MKAKTQRRALFMSALSLLLCVSMLVGTTFAWFTDSVTSSNNIIKSGNLDVEMYWAEGSQAVPTENTGWTDASAGAIFNYNLWEPGYTQVRHIKIANVGSLALKYKVNILANGEVSDLADVIDVYYMDPAVQVANRTDLTDANKLGTLTQVLAKLGETGNGELTAGASDTITIAFKMQETAGNTYMNKAIGTDFSIHLLATQLTYENDSFGNQYDENSALPVVGTGIVPENAQNPTSIPAGKVTVDVPATAPAGTYDVVVANENETTNAEGKTVFAADINLLKDGIKVESNGNVKYLVKIDLGPDKTIAEVLHKGVAVTDFDYDAQTGILQFETDSFSPFMVIYEVKRVVKVDSAEAFTEALANVTEKTEIDATGVTIDIDSVGYDLPTGKKAVSIPGGVTIKNLTVVGSFRGGNTLHFQGPAEQEIVFENCTFELSGRSMGLTFLRAEDGVNSVVYNNCTFKGAVVLEKENGVATYNNCTFTKHPGSGSSYVMAYGGTHYFKGCTFDYTGLSQSSMGTINTASINSVSDSDGSNTTEVILEGCTRINCGTRKYGSNSSLVIK